MMIKRKNKILSNSCPNPLWLLTGIRALIKNQHDLKCWFSPEAKRFFHHWRQSQRNIHTPRSYTKLGFVREYKYVRNKNYVQNNSTYILLVKKWHNLYRWVFGSRKYSCKPNPQDGRFVISQLRWTPHAPMPSWWLPVTAEFPQYLLFFTDFRH